MIKSVEEAEARRVENVENFKEKSLSNDFVLENI
jgi:hypothetical protein